MNRRYLISALIVVGTILIDQGLKYWALTLATLHYNQGFIMGLYSGLPDSIRIVALGCFAGIVFFLYVFLMYIVPSRGRYFKYGLSFLVGGMFGNVVDKIIHGKTVDFIPFHYFGFHTVFNAADIFLWLGALVVMFILVGKDKLVFNENSTRGNYLIWPREQFKVGLNFMLMVFAAALILGIFAYSFFNTTFVPNVPEKKNLMLIFSITYSMITLLMCLLSFMAGIIIGHKSVGPLYAFELYIDDLIQGKDRKLSFRDGDNYRDLEQVADRLRDYIHRHK